MAAPISRVVKGADIFTAFTIPYSGENPPLKVWKRYDFRKNLKTWR
jgi:hypothetical protein